MKYLRYVLVLTLTFVTMSVANAGSLASINSASSDCSTVTVDYTYTGANASIRLTPPGGPTQWFHLGGGSAIVDLAIFAAPIPDGTIIPVDLFDGAALIDSTTITCVLPTVTGGSSNTETEPAAPEIKPLLINDGRIEPFATDRVIYPDAELGIIVRDPNGLVVLFIPIETIIAHGIPESGARLLNETADGYVSVYRLADGQYQANIGPDGEGKVHVATWMGLGFGPALNAQTTTFNQQ